ncbi:MAG: T9SS type A sorting domain-containing protein [Bacteroidetes bacterium]|nr:T9SS type A sorting domain-containing protein [Bacteroidota bacterium]
MYNMQGEIIYQSSFINPISEVDLSNQANGIYIVKIYDGQTILTKKTDTLKDRKTSNQKRLNDFAQRFALNGY